MNLKIAFAGTPEFAEEILQSLIHASANIVGVFTKPDKPKGRGQKLEISPVKQLALRHNLAVFQPKSLRDAASQNLLRDLNPDIFIVVAYGLILPKEILAIPKYGCINVHASLLPRWRGAAPIQHSILAGDSLTGITIMQMDEGLDTGDILAQYPCPIEIHETSGSLYKRLTEIGSKLLISNLDKIEHRKIHPEKQENEYANYASKIRKEDAKIDWTNSAIILDRKIRAFNPWPVAYTTIDGQTLRIFASLPKESLIQFLPGTILQANSKGIEVATGEGILKLIELQLPGGKRLSAAALLNGKPELFRTGTVLGTETLLGME